MPKDTERYRRLPKAGLKIEYRPNVSGVVANLSWGTLGSLGAEPPAGSRAGRGQGAKPPEAELFLFLDIQS